MIRRGFPRLALASSILAACLQVALAAVAAAGSGGGDFPLR